MTSQFVEFDGIRYYGGYYKSHVNGKYLHRAVWEKANGPIPAGMDVHHLDGNKSNNAPENLALIERRSHRAMESKLRWQNPAYREEVRAAISAAKKGKPHAPHSAETRAKMSAAASRRRGIIPGPETRAKMTATRTGRQFSQETKRKMSAARRDYWKNKKLNDLHK